MGGEGDQVDVHREQHELDGHQDDDDVLAVQEDAEDPQREEDRGDREVVPEADLQHGHTPLRLGTCFTSTDSARVRAVCREIDCRRTPTRWRRVSTMAPITATSRNRTEAWNRYEEGVERRQPSARGC